MPTISEFFGMVILMYWRDHPPPHFHVRYKGWNAVVSIETGEIGRGSLPPGAARILREWTLRYQQDLLDNWERCTNGKPVRTIRGADEE
jgi:hypothetical protein